MATIDRIANVVLDRQSKEKSLADGIVDSNAEGFPFFSSDSTQDEAIINGSANDSHYYTSASRDFQPTTAISTSTSPVSPTASRKPPLSATTADTADKRTVSFAPGTTDNDIPQSPPPVTEVQSNGSAGHSANTKLASRLRSFASNYGQQSHARRHSAYEAGSVAPSDVVRGDASAESPSQERKKPQPLRLRRGSHDNNDDGYFTDASFFQRHRKPASEPDGGTRTAPTTPKRQTFSDPDSPQTDSRSRRRPGPVRRATMTDVPGAASDEEGPQSESKKEAWKRRSSAWMQNARQFSSHEPRRLRSHLDSPHAPDTPRPSNLRRFTQLAGMTSNQEGGPSQWRAKTEQGAQKWRQLKASLKLLGQKRKEENRLDQAKSAQLLGGLLAGSPAALILASTFQKDEHDRKKVPVLLEQLKISITDGQQKEDSSGDRHLVFRIELEYGSGLTRMKWVIWRTLRNFVDLHTKFKIRARTQVYRAQTGTGDTRRSRVPKFPWSAFPYFRGLRGFADEDDDEQDDEIVDRGGDDGRPHRRHRRQLSFAQTRRNSSLAEIDAFGNRNTQDLDGDNRRNPFAERQRRKLEQYLRELIRFVILRSGSNRLCKFLELSALGVRLASEGGYHGKEGIMTIQSGKGIDFRRAWTPSLLVERHKPMWFLVRHSYIVCVDSPETCNIYDVFLVDENFDIMDRRRLRDQKKARDVAKTAKKSAKQVNKHHMLRVKNAERKWKLLARNERQLGQFMDSIRFMKKDTSWAQTHRFESFAPVRTNVFAQWLVDARDYMWNVSRAISMAQDVIYIHDWWLSPELYMRRPPAISHKWRLDRLLKQKAESGVKIYVIMYRNINSAIPIDSEYTKFSLLDLHPNIFVQRSPNQVRQNVFFWAHHEKICVVDHCIAFCGGVDLCFGRWDTPEHRVVDDSATGFEMAGGVKNADNCQLWPGKDYSNPRVLDFFKLDEPYGEMYDRTKVPRMPWHDIGMQVVGQPARDLTRHFVQRWNYLLRQRKPTRPTPFLLPPPDFNPADLESLGIDGTCNVQMLRSAGEWSIGTPGKTEHSIMNAYVKLIEMSQHFVYIENQFFISSCETDGTRIRNSIGDALVERIIRAYESDEDWLAVIVIPLVPGFQNTVESQDGTSIRLIMQCQYRTICRGASSIFERLRVRGINAEDYIRFYSLRSWGKLGPNEALVTEQLYIHAKCMVVDDRYAIIGSANINERSMLGDRDSEVAAVVWDNDLIESSMAERPFKVGRFPHTLRVRLMREHLGINPDKVYEDELAEQSSIDSLSGLSRSTTPDTDPELHRRLVESRNQQQDSIVRRQIINEAHSFNHDADWEEAENPLLHSWKKPTSDSRVTGNKEHKKDVAGFGADHMANFEQSAAFYGRDSVLDSRGREVLVNSIDSEGRGSLSTPAQRERSKTHKTRAPNKSPDFRQGNGELPPPHPPRLNTAELGLTLLSQLPALPNTDDTDIGGPSLQNLSAKPSTESVNPLLAKMHRPNVENDCMKDPLSPAFYDEIWQTVAENNTKLFRQVFRCMPDSQVTNWKEYDAFSSYSERFAQAQGTSKDENQNSPEAQKKTGPPGHDITERGDLARQLSVNTDGRKNSVKRKLSSVLPRKSFSHRSVASEQTAAESKPSSRQDNSEPGQNSNPSSEKTQVAEQGAANEQLNEKNEPTLQSTSTARVDFGPTPTRENNGGEPSFDEKRPATNGETNGADTHTTTQRRRRRATTKSSGVRMNEPLLPRAEAEELCNLVQGHLVEWPYDWLIHEEKGGAWLYPVDRMAPLEIYN